MNSSSIKMEAQPSLPPLIKQSATYKLFVPRKVEEKIRYLIRKFPHTEWSGILFINHTGSFEENNLEIHCEDIFPMDLGTSGWTEFKMNEDVTTYIADNIELFDCDIALVHSHHTLGAFFSGQDLKTLQLEGNDTNCFVSLIVDTPGNYVAAITRKVRVKQEVTIKNTGSSYEFFGEGPKNYSTPLPSNVKTIDKEIIEYFMLEVEREVTNNPLDYLDRRFEEIEEKKKASLPAVSNSFINSSVDEDNGSWHKELSFEDFKRRKDNEKELFLFPEEEMGDADIDEWEPNTDIIYRLVSQMIACSFIINKDFDLKQWITKYMVKKYNEIFVKQSQFESWSDFIVEFMISQYTEENIPTEISDNWDYLQHKVASAMYRELCKYPDNRYLDSYKDTLMRYTYE